MKIYRRKHRLVPVSFFAFQDIITALAGCMLIFVLALAAAKNRSAADKAEEKTAPRSEYEQLQSNIKLKRAMLKTEEQKTAILREQIERSELNEQNIELNKRLKNSGRKLEKIAGERAHKLEKMQQQLSILKKQNEQLMLANKELAELIEQSDSLEKQYLNQRRKLHIANGSNRNNIVLTISRSSWLYQAKAGTQALHIGNAANAFPQLKNQLSGLDLPRTRLIIAVRPSAGGFAGTLKNSLQKTFPALEIVAEPLAHETLGGLDL